MRRSLQHWLLVISHVYNVPLEAPQVARAQAVIDAQSNLVPCLLQTSLFAFDFRGTSKRRGRHRPLYLRDHHPKYLRPKLQLRRMVLFSRNSFGKNQNAGYSHLKPTMSRFQSSAWPVGSVGSVRQVLVGSTAFLFGILWVFDRLREGPAAPPS